MKEIVGSLHIFVVSVVVIVIVICELYVRISDFVSRSDREGNGLFALYYCCDCDL